MKNIFHLRRRNFCKKVIYKKRGEEYDNNHQTNILYRLIQFEAGDPSNRGESFLKGRATSIARIRQLTS
jgi:hypothetical protein